MVQRSVNKDVVTRSPSFLQRTQIPAGVVAPEHR